MILKIKKTPVSLVKLDDEGIVDVGFLKVDVEGYELEVLRGAIKTISRDQPTLLVELEERHRKGCVGTVSRYLEGRGYRGYFCADGKLFPVSSFSAETMQRGKVLPGPIDTKYKPYIYNFVFLPSSSTEIKKQLVERLSEFHSGNWRTTATLRRVA